MSGDKESLNILKKLLTLLIEKENELLNIENKTTDDKRSIEAIKSLKEELKETINNLNSTKPSNHISINGISINLEGTNKNQIDNYLQGIINKIGSTEEKNNNKFQINKDLNNLKIGDIITLSSAGNLYKTSSDLSLEINRQEIIESEVQILGVSICYNETIINIFADYPDYSKTIDNLLLDNGEIISYIVGKPTKNDISKLTQEEIDNLIIGFYSIESTKKRGK